MSVMIVDDSQTTRMIARKTLKALGVEDVVEAGDGRQALSLFPTKNISAIFSDWNMPIMSGLEFLTAIRAIDPHVPFIMVTTEGSRAKIISAIQAGVTDYLVKPYTPVQLKEKLTKWIPGLVGT